MTREERVSAHLPYSTKNSVKFIEFVLSKYVESGVDELDQDKLPILLTNKYQSLQDAQDILGNVGSISKLFIEFQEHLYREGVA
jgi:type I restriction enzyme, R subunit